MTLSEVIATNARAIRAAQKLRQADVAERAGLSRTTLSVIEAGGRRISMENVLALCHGLGVPLIRLLDGASPQDRKTLGL